MDVWKGDLTFHLSHGLILLQVLQTKAKTKNAQQPKALLGMTQSHDRLPVLIKLPAQDWVVAGNVGQSCVRHWPGPKEPPLWGTAIP